MSLFSDFTKEIAHTKRSLNAMEQHALFDLKFYLQGDLLTKIDRASMKYSLEARVPLLDPRLIQFSLNLSPDLKYRRGTSKYLLKQLLYKSVPESFFNRPKQGFAIPLETWLRNELRFLIEENLSEPVVTKYNIVSFDHVCKLKDAFLKDSGHYYNRLWLLIVLHKWLQKYH